MLCRLGRSNTHGIVPHIKVKRSQVCGLSTSLPPDLRNKNERPTNRSTVAMPNLKLLSAVASQPRANTNSLPFEEYQEFAPTGRRPAAREPDHCHSC